MRSVGIGPVGTLQARGVFDEQERLVLADFESDFDQDGRLDLFQANLERFKKEKEAGSEE